jgi:hypothetical protein
LNYPVWIDFTLYLPSHKKRRTRRDRVAAQLILQAYPDAGGQAEQSGGFGT